MRDMWPDIIAGLIVAFAFLIGLVLAYRRGFRAALPLRSEGFDFLSARLNLNGSRWRISGEELPASGVPLTVELYQSGSRLTGLGPRNDGADLQLEGVVHDRRVECLLRFRHQSATRPEVWMLEADVSGQTLTGYSIAWNTAGSQLSLRELTLIRLRPSAERNSPEHAGPPSLETTSHAAAKST